MLTPAAATRRKAFMPRDNPANAADYEHADERVPELEKLNLNQVVNWRRTGILRLPGRSQVGSTAHPPIADELGTAEQKQTGPEA